MNFSCQDSCGGKCCSLTAWEGAFVFLTKEDRQRLTRYLQKPIEEIAEFNFFDWTRFSTVKTFQWYLRPGKYGCQFLKTGKCQVYDARPIQCRTYPYWAENLTNDGQWTEKTKKACPGIGKGILDETRAQRLLATQTKADQELAAQVVV